MTTLKNRTVAEILSKLTKEQREEWLEKEALNDSVSSEIEDLPIPSDLIYQEYKKHRRYGV